MDAIHAAFPDLRRGQTETSNARVVTAAASLRSAVLSLRHSKKSIHSFHGMPLAAVREIVFVARGAAAIWCRSFDVLTSIKCFRSFGLTSAIYVQLQENLAAIIRVQHEGINQASYAYDSPEVLPLQYAWIGQAAHERDGVRHHVSLVLRSVRPRLASDIIV
jgi:hypothetical protein